MLSFTLLCLSFIVLVLAIKVFKAAFWMLMLSLALCILALGSIPDKPSGEMQLKYLDGLTTGNELRKDM